MRAMAVKRYGDSEVLEVREMPDPQPKFGRSADPRESGRA